MTFASPGTQTDSLSNLKARVERNPNDGAAWLAIAQTIARTRSGSDLSTAIRKSIELLPNDYQAWLLAALEMQQSRGTAPALQWLQHIAQQRPELAAPRLARAQLQTAEHAKAATQDFLSIIQDFPEDSRAHVLYAELLQNQGHLNAAGNQLEMALNLKPEIAQNWAALAMIRLAEGLYEAVVVAASKALDIDAQARGARLSRAEAYRQAAHWQSAMEDYSQLLKVMPDNPYLLLGTGACLAGSGDFEAALGPLKAALKIKPDLAEASFNIGLALASQGKIPEAFDCVTKLAQQNQLPAELRNQVLITQAVLMEQQRLPHFLGVAAKSHNLRELQEELQSAPGILLQSHYRTVDSLRAMALGCQQFAWQIPDLEHGLEQHQVAFVEACLLSRAADDAAEMVNLWQAQQLHQTDGRSLDAAGQNLRNVWNVVLDRQRLSPSHINQGNGEAWLRYWHFRIFDRLEGCLPGLFKFAPNIIGLHRTTAPQQVINSVRVLLDEIYPSLPAGLSRALLLLASINRIHAFVDGNGRMARFAFNWELEGAALPPLQWTPALRNALTLCLDSAQYQNDFEPFQECLQQVRNSTETLFGDFSKRLAQI